MCGGGRRPALALDVDLGAGVTAFLTLSASSLWPDCGLASAARSISDLFVPNSARGGSLFGSQHRRSTTGLAHR
jgi:hypothetical protein